MNPVETKKKRQWRKIRAHVNPLSNIEGYDNPISPDHVDWSRYFPNHVSPHVTMADVGCGFGGLLEELGKIYKETCILGMEIREPVVEKVKKRISKLQEDNEDMFTNIGVVRTNAMKYFVKFFKKHQLEKIFFCFPDPHWKKANHRRRIVSINLVAEYVYCLCPDGRIYTITDVLELHTWMGEHLDQHPLLERVDEDEEAMHNTDEGKKVTRLGGKHYVNVFKRLASSK